MILRFLGKRVPKPQIVAPAERKESFATKVLPISFRPFHSPSDKCFTCKAAIASARAIVRRELRRLRRTAERASSRSVWDLKAGLSGVFPLPGCSAGLLAPLFEPRQRTVLPPTRPAAVAYRFRSERPATSSYDRRTSLLISLSGTSRSKRTLIQCRLFIW